MRLVPSNGEPTPERELDVGMLAQKRAEEHLDALDAALEASESGEDVEWPESAGPYCGCQTCLVREVLWVAWPIITGEPL